MSNKKTQTRLITARLLSLVDETSGGKATVFARKAGIPASTFQYYKDGRVPNWEHLIRISETCGVCIDWLLTGIGPKNITDHSEQQLLDPDPEITELMEGARRVLTSGNPIAATMLEMHIKQIESTIKADKERDELKRKIAQLEQERQKDEAEHKEEPSPDKKVA